MGWLRDTFLESGNNSTEVERIQYVRAYILDMIGGYLMSNLSQNLVHLRWLLKLVDFRAAGELTWGWNHPTSYVGIPTALEDIRLLLDQRSEAQVSLVNNAIVEMHQTDRVLRQFGFRQPIPEEPKVLDDQHRIDLRRI
ncbi:hypothetical protein PVK06_002307 [Gossypium arboreum]|uniref:Uncharacterized protein n=1 Tax=Gossypium arboreum TaxID=29729 RepID=A0ABR0R382_GOSAR|nr:hypothetical protein PVK06_002307 [Gossypium arboreum]